jgi:amino acid adenylation domain-containing protein
LSTHENHDPTLARQQSSKEKGPCREWQGPACIHELIEEQAGRTPERTAVRFEGESVTYRELMDRTARLAGHLRRMGVEPDTRVGVCAERSVEMVTGLLGVLRAGGAYVPLDPGHPADRLAYMVEDAAAPVVVAQRHLSPALPAHGARTVLLDDPEVFAGRPEPLPKVPPEALAYVIYTSGSTGRPKGAMNAHSAVRNRLLWMREDFGLGPDERALQKTPFSFDVSVWELFAPLVSGACLVMARPGGHQDPAYLVDVIERERITLAHFVPSMLRVFLGAPGLERLGSLRRVLCSGEAVTPDLERRFFERFGSGGPELHNLYGPTETAIEVSWWRCGPGRSGPVPIGHPIANVTLSMAGPDLEPVAPGEPGELLLGGVQTGRGYHNRPALTAERFVPDPFSAHPGARVYRSGDLCRFREDGAVEYLGRIDHQVKIRGVRIELGEIESALGGHPSVRAAAVLARERNGEARLVAYVVPRDGAVFDEPALRAHLAACLPEAMLPAVFVVLDDMPLTPSGKVDRRALPEPEERRRSDHAPPRTALERALARLWEETLGVEAVGLRDSFFDLGGTSITGAVLINRLQAEMGEILHVVTLFDAPTLGELAAWLGREHRAAVARVWGEESLPEGGADAGAEEGRRVDEGRLEELRRLIQPLAPYPADGPRNPRAVLVLAPPRSGTTLMRVMLGGHPGLFSPPELELLTFNTMAERRTAFSGRDSFWREGVLRAVVELRGCSPDQAEALVEACEHAGWSTRRFYGWLQEQMGGRMLVDKSTNYPLDPEVLRRAEEVFEEPFYVHLVRHPYGMIHSFEEAKIDQLFFRRAHPFGRRELAELVWTLSHRNILAFLEGIPAERRHRIRFEDLVRDPEGELRRLCAALGIDYHADMADPYAGPHRQRRSRMTDGLHEQGRMIGDMKFHEHRGVEAATAERWREAYSEDFLGEPAWAVAEVFGYPHPGRPRAGPVVPVPRRQGEGLPLSPAQERLWFLDRMLPGSPVYNASRELRLRGPLDPAALGRALSRVVDRHEALRTVFREVATGPVQVMLPEAGIALPVVDLSSLPDPREEARRVALETARLSFGLERGPILRTVLLRLRREEHALRLDIHHIATDGWSMGVLGRELEALYRGEAPAPPPVQYADHAVWQRRWLEAEGPAQLAAWKKRLEGLPPALDLPADFVRPPMQTFRGGLERAPFPAELAGRLEEIGRRGGATLFMTLLAGFQVLLHRLTGRDDLAVGVPSANRSRPEIEGLIGFFVNNLVMRADLSGDPPFEQALKRVREAALFGYGHPDLPFERLVAELSPERDLSRPPLFQVAFSVQDPPQLLDLGGGLRGELVDVHTGTAKFDLWLQLDRGEDAWSARAEYASDLFDPATVRRWLGHLRVLLEGIAADPGARLSDLSLLTATEREQVMVDWNRTDAEVPEEPVHVLVRQWAERTPDALAVSWPGGEMTYGELGRRSAELAERLREMGVGPEMLVALRLERSPELVVSALAVLEVGGAYLPIDPAWPAERQGWILVDSGAAVVVEDPSPTLPRFAGEGAAAHSIRIHALEREGAPSPARSVGEGRGGVFPSTLAYVIYTSGSTGTPKGTELGHRGLSSFIAWHRRTYGLTPSDRSTLLAGPGFDASVWEMWSALTAGASLHIPPPDTIPSAPDLLAWMAERGITVSFMPTPLAEAVLAEPMPAGLALGSLLTGGDRLRRRPAPGLPFELVNHYGPTESTVVATAGRVDPAGERVPSIGRPIANTRVLILDRMLHPAPVGVPGELCIAGEGLARGYRNRPELTAERFVPAEGGRRLYRTGDLARWLPSGDIEFLGRIDHQVKIRGFRIELGEIEAALGRLPQVREAAVLEREGRLAAYVVPRETVAAGSLREALAAVLPDAMVPTLWTFLDTLPLTPNGKVDRRALARMAPADVGAAAMEPRTELEIALARVWAELFRVERVGLQDDFFSLGGHSLLAARLAFRVRETCGVSLGVRGLFESPTVEALAARVEEARRSGSPPTPPPVPVSVPRGDGGLPLSFAQQRLWFLEILRPGTPLYNLPQVWSLRGPLSVSALAEALGEAVRRHESLRTIFTEEPLQVVLPKVDGPFPLEVVDLPEDAAEELLRSEAARPFDLRTGPLFRALLVRLGGEDHRLLLAMHHIVSDGWSMDVLAHELSALYRGGSLPPLPIQYPEFAVWQRLWLSGEVLERQLAWWRERLAGAPAALELPTDFPRPAVASLRGGLERVSLGDLAAGLARVARGSNATVFMTVLAAFQALLQRYTGQDDLLVGAPVAGRDRGDLEGLVGFFVNLVPIRAELAGAPAFDRFLAATREAALSAFAHQDVPFERLVEELEPERDLSRAPLVQAMLLLQDEPSLPDFPGVEAGFVRVHPGTAKFDLTLTVERAAGGLRAHVEYASDLFEAATARRLLGHFQNLLEGIVAAPETPLPGLPLLGHKEKAQIAAWNDGMRRDHDADGLLHGLFEEQARRTPGALAVAAAGGVRLTYAELERRSAELARHLRGLGVGPEVPVGLFLKRSADLIVAMLAVLRSGGLYVPVDPAYPEERIAFLLEDSGCGVILTEEGLAGRLPQGDLTPWPPLPSPSQPPPGEGERGPLLLALGGGAPSPGVWVGGRWERGMGGEVSSRNLAYLIYTSGSTGRPKAVAIEHRSAVVLARWAKEAFTPEELSGVIASTSITFDLSVFEIFVTLAWGGTVFVVENALAVPDFFAAEPGVPTLINTVPSAIAELLRTDGLPATVRTVNLAGEALTRALSDKVYERPETERLYNLYGPSEDTTYSTWALIERSGHAPAIGRPVHDSRAFELDPWLQPLPVGVPGELFLAGAGLARGYLGRPELTAERFIPDPFSGTPGSRMYRTGDRVRLRPDGELEYLGRLDYQVKIRGFRIELGEVEAVLARHPAVSQTAVLARDNRLIAWVALREPVSRDVLRGWLAERLPEYMVPGQWAFLDVLPLTPNGKVDRKVLARLAAPEEAGTVEAPRNPVEELLAGLFAEVLGQPVGIRDDFFHLGGHSLLAVQLASRIRAAFGVDPGVRGVFERPTVAGLAERIAHADRPTLPPVVPVDREHGAPLSFAQERLWFLDRFERGSNAYNLPLTFRISGSLSVEALSVALGEVVRRHEALRTVFREGPDGQPIQVVRPFAAPVLPVVDLPAEEADRREAELAALPFDLETGPLFRAVLLRTGPEEHRLLLSLHHVVSDGWSVGVLVRELSAAYAGRPLPELPVQYADHAVWQRQWLSGESDLAWWRERLAGIPSALELPVDRARPPVQSYRGEVRRMALPVEPGELRRSGATFFMTALAAFDAFLGRITAEEDLVVGTPVANRDRTEVEGLIGFFVNTLVLRVSLAGDPTFEELLARVRSAALEAYAHQDLPFEKLVAELSPERNLSQHPIFQVSLSAQELPQPGADFGPGLDVRVAEVRTPTSKFDLSLHLGRSGDGLFAAAEYASDLFDAATVDRFLGCFRTLLAGAVANPGSRISELPLMTAEEQAQLRAAWSGGAAEPPSAWTLHGMIEEQARRTPDAVALDTDAGLVTFAGLMERADAVARTLAGLGVGPETRVALCASRTAELVAGFLGILKSGGACVLLDPGHVSERLAWVLEDSGAAVLATTSDLEPRLPSGLPRLLLDGDLTGGPEPATVLPDQIAYVIYTSGSTGKPKGVAVAHREAAEHSATVIRFYGLGPADRVLQFASPAFDVAVEEILPTLMAGSTLVLRNGELFQTEALAGRIAELGLTVLNLPTAVWHHWVHDVAALTAAQEPLRLIIVGGEEVLAEPARQWLRTPMRPVRLLNGYGPTETVITATLHEVAEETLGEGVSVPIGRPLAGRAARVLDLRGHPLPVGVPGELHLSGELARGYLNRPGLTAERFVPDAFSDAPGARLYRTGDLVRLKADGALEFLGRIDQQVKVRGFRVEPAEIEAALAAHPMVAAAAVLVRSTRHGRQLVAYVQPGGPPPSASELRDFLEPRLPAWMVPAGFAFLDALPLTASGKVDRATLGRMPFELQGGTEGEEPATDTERALAGIWMEVLGVERVGRGDHFFHLGGHSLLAMRLASRVRARLGVELELRDLFEAPTLAGLAERVEKARKAVEEVVTVETPAGSAPLSSTQQRLWFLDRLHPGHPAYNMPVIFDVEGPLRPDLLEAALDGIIRRHAVLRSTIRLQDGDPVQIVSDPVPHRLAVLDSEDPEAATLEEQRRPFDLETGPLVRSLLIRTGSESHRLVLTLHHIVSDGWSVEVIVRELRALYAGQELTELPIQYADHALRQRRWSESPEAEAQLAWWQERLAGGTPDLELPADRPRPAVQSLRGGIETLEMPEGFAEAIDRLGRERGATPFLIELAAFDALLLRYTGQEDLWVGTPVANRPRPELEGLIGLFVNTVVLRTDAGGDPTFAGLLGRARETVLAAFAHQELPFERLVEELAPARDLSRNPLAQVFISHSSPAVRQELAPGVTLVPRTASTATAKLDLSLNFGRNAEGRLVLSAEHSADLFDGTTVRRLLEHLGNLLQAAVEEPEVRISDLPLMGAAERDQVLVEWNLTGAEIPDEPVHVLFHRWAERTPDALALSWEDGEMTYGELARRAEARAEELRRAGVGPETVVPICFERSPELVVEAIAVLSAGGAYLPIDPDWPEERRRWILADAGTLPAVPGALPDSPETLPAVPGALLGALGTLPAAPGTLPVAPGTLPVVPGALPVEPGTLPAESGTLPAEPGTLPGESLAYVIYTSGSTGTPKGTELRHRGLSSYIAWHRRSYLDPSHRSAFLAAPGFDASVWDTWAPLTAGASLHIPPKDAVPSAPRLLAWMAERRITIGFLTTALGEAVLAEPRPAGLALRRLLIGGERLHRRPGPDLPFELINHYGPTETTIVVTAGRVEPEGDRPPHIGRPVSNMRMYVVDPHLKPVPVGVPGELCIAGVGLARSYRHRPALTAEKLVPNPFGEPGERLYRTGDLARWLPSGDLELVGRIDHQVKLRGFRIELGEVEAVLTGHPLVGAAVAMVREDRLIAWVVPSGPEAPEGLRSWLETRLPAFMIPAAFVALPELPLTPNGKVDRRALPAPDWTGAKAYVAPRTELEQEVAQVWKTVLGVERVGLHDSFWDLGGHSLLATRILVRLRDAFGVELPLQVLFQAPTLEAFSTALGHAVLAAFPEDEEGILPAERGSEAPLSFAQERLWFLDRLEGNSVAYNIPMIFVLRGDLKPAALEAALGEVVRRHEVLRTVFVEGDGGVPVQRIKPFSSLSLPLLDVTLEEALRVESALARTPFDLARGPLLRAVLSRISATEHRLFLSVHHAVSDGWSADVLIRELAAAYRALSENRASDLPELPVQYADYAVWQRRWLSGETLERELGWWRGRLAGAPMALELPTDRPRPAKRGFRGIHHRDLIPADLVARLGAMGRSSETSLFMVVLAGYQALLSRLTGARDLLVGTPIANRQRVEIEGLIGLFVNTLALRADLSGSPSFDTHLGRTRDFLLGAFEHQDLPFERLVEDLAPERDLSRSPLIQTLLVLVGQVGRPVEMAPGLLLEQRGMGTGTAKMDVTLYMGETPDGALDVTWEADADLFDASTLARFSGWFKTLLAGITAAPDARLSEIPLLGEAERALLTSWGGSALETAPPSVLERFAGWAERIPEAPAVVGESTTITWRELESRSANLARRLRRLGAGPETRVAVCLDRTPDMVVALLGVMRSGAAYVPLDPDQPAGRRRRIVEDAGALALVTAGELAMDLDGMPRIRLESVRTEAGEVVDSPSPIPSSLAYVLYTSGSTGEPKGVGVEHRQLAAYVDAVLERLQVPSRTSFAVVTTFAADLGHTSVFSALASGGTLHVVARELSADPARLAVRFEARPVDVLKIVPSHLAALLAAAPRPERVLPRKRLVVGGEASSWDLVRRVRELAPECRIVNHYGPTETTVGVLTCGVMEAEGEKVPLGRPLRGTTVRLLDRDLQSVPPGLPGELWIGGAQVARGYLGRPDLTAERFLPDAAGGRLYRTGDRARWLASGVLEFLGRADDQVKIRGHRVEPGEVAAVLARHPAVRESAVLPVQRGGETRLAAWAVPVSPTPNQSPARTELRAWLSERLPEAMVPFEIAVVAALPLTPNGKLDRWALAAMANIDAETSEAPEPEPASPAEELMAAVVAELLGVERVSREDDFFDLGGHSLLAIRLVARIREAFGAEVDVRSVFERRTVAGLAARVEEVMRGGTVTPPLEPWNGPGAPPLSFAQERLWFLDRLEPGAVTYNVVRELRFRGPLDPAALAKALGEIERRHEPLRTRFRLVYGEPVQIVEPYSFRPLPIADLSGLPETARRAELARRVSEEGLRPFDLARGPMLRAVLLRLGDEEHVLVLGVHHIAFDAWSLDVLRRELAALYAGRPLPSLPVRYSDYAGWQRRWLSGEVLESQLGFWKETLAGSPPVLELPLDRPRPAVQGLRGGFAREVFPRQLLDGLERLGRGHRATVFMTLLAGFQALLSRITGQRDVLVGTPVANRERPEIQGLIGFFVNTLVMRADLSGDPSFPDLLVRVRESALRAYAHQDLPFERLVSELVPGRDLSRTPLFQAVLSWQPSRPASPELAPGLALEIADVDSGTSKFDLTLFLGETREGLVAMVEYAADLFDRSTVRRWLGHLRNLLEGIVEEESLPVSALPLLGDAERAQVAWEWNDTATEQLTDPTIHGLFEAQARRFPDRLAVIGPDRELTYAELDLRAERLADRLREAGVRPDERVGLCAERSAALVAAALGILKAGGAYLPLDPQYPAERLAGMIADAEVRVVVVQEGLEDFLPATGAVTIPLRRSLAEGEPSGFRTGVDPASLGFVLFTSGSTGRPKGVGVTHRNAVRLLRTGYARYDAEQVFLQIAPVAFDASTFEMWGPLLHGGRLVVFPPGPPDLRQLGDAIERHGVTTMFLTSGLFHQMVELHLERLRPLKQLLTGGDVLSPVHIRRAVEGLPGTEVIAVYGPTECTTFTTTWTARPEEGPVPIGRPIADARVFVLGASLEPVPVGVVGQLHIGGDGLARGYQGRPELTAERFVPGPGGERLYATGDLARWRPDGVLEFLGRVDHQVKLRGFRIELGEIESVLTSHPEVESAVVIAREDTPGDKRLAAYVVPSPDGAPDIAELRALVELRLPAFMVPSAFVVLPELPLTANGKVDRRALPAPDFRDSAAEFIPPGNAVEQEVAEIWRQVLGAERVGLHDSFWELGGHSLLATKVLARLEEALGLALPLQVLFEFPTLGGFAAAVGQHLMDEMDGLSDVEVRELLEQESRDA